MGFERAGSEVKGACRESAGVHLCWGPAITSEMVRVLSPLSLELAPPGLGAGVHLSFTWESDPSLGGEKTTFQAPCLSQLPLGYLGSLLALGGVSPQPRDGVSGPGQLPTTRVRVGMRASWDHWE